MGEQLKTKALGITRLPAGNGFKSYLIGFFTVQEGVDRGDGCTTLAIILNLVITVKIFNRGNCVVQFHIAADVCRN
jgi:hypothetical protein